MARLRILGAAALGLVMLASGHALAQETRRDERQEGRQERRDDRQEGARNVGMSDERAAAIGETTTSCYAWCYCAASRPGF